jgi:hypothetical protein
MKKRERQVSRQVPEKTAARFRLALLVLLLLLLLPPAFGYDLVRHAAFLAL